MRVGANLLLGVGVALAIPDGALAAPPLPGVSDDAASAPEPEPEPEPAPEPEPDAEPPAPQPTSSKAPEDAPAGFAAAPASTATPPPKPTPKREEPAADESSQEPSDDDEAETRKEKRAKFPHNGLIVDLRLGTIGCVRQLCKAHDAKPGFRIDGLLGGNIAGFVDVGLMAGWGMMIANVDEGTDILGIFGIDLPSLPEDVRDMLNLDDFIVNSAKLDTIQVGFNVRGHFIPRGRVDVYAGTGIAYNLFRAIYDGDRGETKFGFHGLAFPLQAGLVGFVHKNIALGVQFDYMLTWYGGLSVRGVPGKFGAPLSVLKDQAAMAGVKLPGDLPHFWTVGAVIHLRFGRKSGKE